MMIPSDFSIDATKLPARELVVTVRVKKLGRLRFGSWLIKLGARLAGLAVRFDFSKPAV